jgi:PAS domain S-box-containing protein
MNDQAEALFAYRSSDVVGSGIDHLLPPRLQPRLPELRAAFDRDPQRRTLVDGHSFAVERSDGTEVPVELSMSLITNEDGTREFLCSVRDLTARRRAEAQLRSSERRLREMANAVPAMVCFVDTKNRYRFVNDAYARWHGWERRQMEGRLVREVIGEKLYVEMEASINAALSGTPTHFRGEMKDTGERRIPVDVSLVPQFDETAGVTGYFVVVFDVSHEVAAREADRRHREELAHVSRVATMGELAASIAHELNQPLSAIVANAQAARHLLEVVPPDLGEVSDALTDIATAGQRAGDVISSMRAFLQHGETRDEPIDPGALANDVLELLHSEAISRGVVVRAVGAEGTAPLVRGDPVQIKQVLLNLVMNALEAASRAPAGAREVVVEVSVRGREVELAVRDSGPGLPTRDPEDLFAPFVSRRPGGLGMGLAIARGIAEAHDGRVWGANHPDGGAIFRLRLPAT